MPEHIILKKNFHIIILGEYIIEVIIYFLNQQVFIGSLQCAGRDSRSQRHKRKTKPKFLLSWDLYPK